MFELNGSYSDVQKTKTKTASRLCFWLPKIRCHKRAHKNSTGKCLICVRKKIYHGPVLNLKFWVGFDCFTFFTDESRMKNSYFHYWISGISPPEMNPFGADARTLTGRWLWGERFHLSPIQILRELITAKVGRRDGTLGTLSHVAHITCILWPKRVVTFETFDQSDEETRPDWKSSLNLSDQMSQW